MEILEKKLEYCTEDTKRVATSYELVTKGFITPDDFLKAVQLIMRRKDDLIEYLLKDIKRLEAQIFSDKEAV